MRARVEARGGSLREVRPPEPARRFLSLVRYIPGQRAELLGENITLHGDTSLALPQPRADWDAPETERKSSRRRCTVSHPTLPLLLVGVPGLERKFDVCPGGLFGVHPPEFRALLPDLPSTHFPDRSR